MAAQAPLGHLLLGEGRGIMRVGVGRTGHLRVAFALRHALLAERARWILWLPVAVGAGAGGAQ